MTDTVDDTDAVTALIVSLRAELASAADPAKAEPMRAYMKSSMPYLGIATPEQRVVYRRVFAEHPLASVGAWRSAVLTLWREARYREERYAAIALAGDRRYRAWQTLDALPSSASSTGAPPQTRHCSTPASRPTSPTASSSSAKRLVGRCASTPAWPPTPCAPMWTPTRPRSAPSVAARR